MCKLGGVAECLKQGHCFVHRSIFMQFVKDMLSVCWLWFVVFYLSCVFLEPCYEAPTSLAHLIFLAVVAC